MSPRIAWTPAFLALAVVLIAITLAACASEGQSLSAAGRGDPARAGIAPAATAYRIVPGDKLKITVFGEPDLSGQFELSTQGTLTLPLIGDVPARGKTLAELRTAIAERLANGYLKNPRISVEILNYRPIYVHGEVRSGGEFAYKQGLTLRDAIAMAGGYTYRAATGYLLITRAGSSGEERINLPSDAPVLPGDNIRVPERFF